MWVFGLLKLFAMLLLSSIVFFFLVPQALKHYQKWKIHKNIREFSGSMMLFAVAGILLLFVYLSLMLGLIRQNLYDLPKWGEFALDALLMYVTWAWFIPTSLRSFYRWKDKHSPLAYSGMLCFGFLALCSFSFLATRALIAVLNTRF